MPGWADTGTPDRCWRVVHRLSSQEDIAEKGGARGFAPSAGKSGGPGAGDELVTISSVTGKRDAAPEIGRGSNSLSDDVELPHKELVARAEVVIEAESALICNYSIRAGWIQIRLVPIFGSGYSFLACTAIGFCIYERSIAWKRLAGEFVDQGNGLPGGGVGESGKVARPLRGGGTIAAASRPPNCAALHNRGRRNPLSLRTGPPGWRRIDCGAAARSRRRRSCARSMALFRKKS